MVAIVVSTTLGLAGLAAALGGGTPAGGWAEVPGGVHASAVAEDAASLERTAPQYGVSARARRDIPTLYLRLYLLASRRYGLDWAILAGIGRVECDHGRDPDPSCTREGAVNSAGAGGPAQFLASTWSAYGVSASGHGAPDRWNPADAILGMANYLRAAGAPADYRRAIYAYNHAWWYVAEVERWAAVYRAPVVEGWGAGPTAGDSVGGASAAGAVNRGLVSGPVIGGPVNASLDGGPIASRRTPGAAAVPVEVIPGERAMLSPDDGHVALVPQNVPPVVQAMVVAGNELQDLPYGPAGHPNPLGALSEDCSSAVNYVLYRAGVRPLAEILRENPVARSYVDWDLSGPGRWVTIYATRLPTEHVFIVIAGLRLDTSHDGTDVGPNRGQSGPRWRVLDHIPTWAHWSVRHPPGL